MTWVTWLLLMSGVALNAAAQLLLKAGTRQIGEFAFSLNNLMPIGLKLATEPHIVGGLACYAVSVVAWILVLSRVEVSLAYPMVSFGYIVTAVASWWLFGETLSVERIVGIVVIIFGVFLITRS